ncbi:MAG TPA: phosphatase PAP2 family protein [Tepidiformaceae bacterium]|nr:phosphatase PAP2 family protein [Tepidiformaceae bacterium]
MLRADAPVMASRLPESHLLRDAVYTALYPTYVNLFHWLTWIFALGVEMSIVLVLTGGRPFAWEISVTREIQGLPGGSLAFDLTAPLTNTASVGFVLLFLGVVAFLGRRGHREAIALLLLSFPLHLLAQLPARVIERPGPSSQFAGIEGIGGFSTFPSAQAEYAIAFYGFLAYLLMLRFTRDWQRNALLWGWVGFVVTTGLARIATGHQWPVDIIASYVAGLGILSLLIWLHGAVLTARAEQEAEGATESLPSPVLS